MRTACSQEIKMEFISLIILSVLISTLIRFLFFSSSKAQKGLPPGPKPWPIVGNLLQIGDNRHSQFAEMAKTYGDLFTLKLGTRRAVVASTSSLAMEILKTNDRVTSGRYVFQSFRLPNHIENSIVWSDCNDAWNRLRKVCRTELFTHKMVEAHAHMRESKATEMVKYLKGKQGDEVNIVEIVFETLGNTFGQLFFSQDVFKLGDPTGGNAELKDQLARLLELGSTTNPADYFPFLGRFDLLGQKKEVAENLKHIYDVWGVVLQERKAMKAAQGKNEYVNNDFVDVLLDSGLDDFQINALLMELLGAGTQTSTTTIEWALSELTRNTHTTTKIRAELESVVGQNLVKESDIPNLLYLQACIKETLRLHPTAPLLLPRRAVETFEIMNYTVPKDCQIMVNVWAIGRDPRIWKDPLSFSPERFLNSNVDFKGNHFELLPFGGGRRICPAMPLATQLVNLMVATIVQNFEWDLPNGTDPRDLVMDEKVGLTLHKDPPLHIVHKSRA